MTVPAGIGATGVYVSVGSTPSGTQPQRTLMVAQKLTAGEATANALVRVTSEAEAIRLGGQWSQLHLMYRAYAANDPVGDVWASVLADASGGSEAAQTRTITIAATDAEAGTLAMWIAGKLVTCTVAASDAAGTIAASLNTAIAATTGLPVTSGVSSAVVTLTSRHVGVAAGQWGAAVATDVGIPLPAGVTATVADGTAGAVDPTLTTAIANLGDEPFAFVISPYLESTPLTAIRNEIDRRWGPLGKGAYGVIFAARRGTVSAAISAHATNDANLSVMSVPAANTTPAAQLAAAYAGAAAASLRGEPSRPVHRLDLRGVQATPQGSGYTQTEQSTAALNGIAYPNRPTGASRDQIGRAVTQYLTQSGTADQTFRQLEARYTTARYASAIAARLSADYPRAILLADGDRADAGVSAATPREIRASVIGEHEVRRGQAWVSGEVDPVVALDPDEADRVNIQVAPTLAGQAVVLAVDATFSALTGG